MKNTITKEEVALLDKYFRTCNYMSVAMLYLRDNPLLRRNLEENDIKRKLVGYWGSAPGQNFMYTHLNRIINKYNLNMIYQRIHLLLLLYFPETHIFRLHFLTLFP